MNPTVILIVAVIAIPIEIRLLMWLGDCLNKDAQSGQPETSAVKDSFTAQKSSEPSSNPCGLEQGYPSPTPAEEIAELVKIAADWQRQFHRLEAQCIQHGMTVRYGDDGMPLLDGGDTERLNVAEEYLTRISEGVVRSEAKRLATVALAKMAAMQAGKERG